jgi:nucleoside-diphosphate-sugar epimerase
MKVLVTGCAGFIGFHIAKKLVEGNMRFLVLIA